MKNVLLSTAYLGPVQYYTKLYAAPTVYLERHDHYVKQTYRNRCLIAGPAGVQALTIPIEHATGPKTAACDVRISDHGDWRHLHWAALVSAYEGSPFFEYFADGFHALYRRRFTFLVDFNDALQELVCSWLGLFPRIVRTRQYVDDLPPATLDLRDAIRPKRPAGADPTFCPAPYWQVFAGRHGFLPNLSIVDLLFNMGLEARLVLRASIVDAEASAEMSDAGGQSVIRG